MNKLSIFLTCCLVFISGCSQKYWYDQSQGHQANECKPYIHDAQTYNKCVEDTQKSYEDYKKDRDGILEN